MSQQKELMYVTAISSTISKALKHHTAMTEEKDYKKIYIAILLDLKPDEIRAGKCVRAIDGKDKMLYVRNIIEDAIIAVVGCDDALGIKLLEHIDEYRRAVVKNHEPGELENIRLDLDQLFDQCLRNDRKIDEDNIREGMSTFFNLVDLLQVKDHVDMTHEIDDAIKKSKEDGDMVLPRRHGRR